MKNPTQLISAVRSAVEAGWAEAVTAEASAWPQDFSVGSPTQAELEADFDGYHRQATLWRQWAEDTNLELVSVLRRVHGSIQSIPTHVNIPSLQSASALLGGDWPALIGRAQTRATQLRDRFPGVQPTESLIRGVVDLNDTNFELLCTVARWFRQNTDSDLAPRQLPIDGVTERWLADHAPLVTALAGLDTLPLASEQPVHIPFSYLDPDHLSEGGRRYDSVTLGDTMTPLYAPDIIVICGDSATATHFPELPLAVSVDGTALTTAGADATTRLHLVDWVTTASHLIFWGDMDPAGFHTLVCLREAGLTVQSILMDRRSYDRYSRFGESPQPESVPEPLGEEELSLLSAAERQLYLLLTDPEHSGPRRVDQTCIPLAAAHRAVLALVDN